jgi:hypothetical protein
MKCGGFGMSVAPTDDLRRWQLFAESTAAVPTTAATTDAGLALAAEQAGALGSPDAGTLSPSGFRAGVEGSG